ncbi:CYTH domain-containing protein [Lederbergia graminis]|uniref:CYTH domain-containing protein n=1 Tax=Lederbergia graminis TaxID=735518 RepID=A0ABW0LF99_9BACI|nr:CYTH domain-containing protein [Paenibacillus bovis]
MSRNLEIEFKNIVSKSEFDYLIESFQISEKDFFTQINHYFDTKLLSLRNVGAALRIRELPNRSELTLKIPQGQGLLEINDHLTEHQVKEIMTYSHFPPCEVLNELRKMEIEQDEIECVGSLRTDRAEIPYKNGTLVFDHSYYLGKEDFEIEYEVANWDEGNDIFRQLLMEYNIKVRPTLSKIARLYEQKMR